MSASTPPPTTFSLSDLSLKLDTAAHLTPHIGPLLTTPPPPITTLLLNGNTLGVPACEALAPILRSLPTLQTANLADIFTSRLLAEIPPALSALLTALLDCPALHTVDLSDNAFGLNTVAPLVAFLKAHVPLRHLVLNNNGLGPHAGALIAQALEELAARKEEARRAGREVPDLETIVCGRNRLESGSMAAWASALRRHPGVRVVRMTQNGIRQEGIAMLLREGLSACEGLEVLDLQDNTFTLVGSRALAGVVEGWKGLRELGVGDCLLGGKGSVSVFGVLAKGVNQGLRTLRVQFGEVDGRGLSELVRAVKGGALEGLRRVELNGNRFAEDDERVVELREVLEERREAAGEEEGEEWGIDELEDMESEEDEDEEDEDDEKDREEDAEEEEKEMKATSMSKDADLEENAPVAEKADAEVDELADALQKTI
ncbi:Ran GTPase-activating protein 1 [Xylographa opegraphella]|nr:Ran GTPase-activating protein 1 [Xylographa opegraphella]